jgi:hypothetical protein
MTTTWFEKLDQKFSYMVSDPKRMAAAAEKKKWAPRGCPLPYLFWLLDLGSNQGPTD